MKTWRRATPFLLYLRRLLVAVVVAEPRPSCAIMFCMIVRPNSSTPAQMGSFCKFAIEPDGAAPTTAASIGLALLLVPLAPEERAVYLRPTIIEIPQFFVFNPQNNDLYVYS